MRVIAGLFGFALLATTLLDAFLTVIVARRAQRIFHLANYFYRVTWAPYAAVARHVRSGRRREDWLSFFGPLSLLFLLVVWVFTLVVAFALLQWSAGLTQGVTRSSFAIDLYISATTFFTMGSTEPTNVASKILVVCEVALGYSFLGITIGYPPVLYGLYNSRETRISLLDARAGSPPTAAELIARRGRTPDRLENELKEWEEWESAVLQSHLSYPMLGYFRSQHTNESWLGALTTILDTSALVMVGAREGDLQRQARLTFAMGRHALVDLAAAFHTPPKPVAYDRLDAEELEALRAALRKSESCLANERVTADELRKVRGLYESYAEALAAHLLVALPPWVRRERGKDNWQATSWDGRAPRFAVSDPYSSE